MKEERNYTGRVFLITLLVTVFMLGLSQLPGYRVGKTKLKRINILSDIVGQEEHPELEGADLYFDTTFLAEGRAIEAEEQAARADSARKATPPPVVEQQWKAAPAIPVDKAPRTDVPRPAPSADSSAAVVPFEDFGGDTLAMSRFYASLLDGNEQRPVRIAVLGDSFIEGDIITADIREQLQDLYGGCGVGFIPFSSSVAMLRSTARHTFSGWTTYNVKDYRQAPEALKDKFFISGNLCIPSEGASVRVEGVGFRKHIDRADVARLIFMNRESASLHVVVNDTLSRDFHPDPSPYVQQIAIHAPIRSIAVSVSDTAGFVGYGIEFESGQGVSLDNYSIRGNSGLALFATNAGINTQIGKMLGGYDLIVLQYGLNVMSADVMHYDSYAKNFVKVINYMKRCFPSSSILVMSVCDRSTQRDGEFVTMPSVGPMIDAQRSAAREAGVAFWNTFEAMGGYNSMVRFVDRNWAAKDYTHIGYRGGKFVAGAFMRAVEQGLAAERQAREEAAEARKPEVPRFDFYPESGQTE